jgi:DNA alkylation damage repair protein AlkB
MSTLFDSIREPGLPRDLLGPGTAILNGFALGRETELAFVMQAISKLAPFRHMITPGGFRMSVALTNCGTYGWVTDRTGYRYDSIDPETGQHWPGMPGNFLELARDAASAAGFPSFNPDACLINRYEPGSRLTLHQRTKTNKTSRNPSFRSRSDCRQPSSLEVWNVPIRLSESRYITATSSSGAVRPGFATTGSTL